MNGLIETIISENSKMNFVVVDLECTCDCCNDFSPNEIIEIGALVGRLTHESFDVKDATQIYVKPTVRPDLTPFCVELTGIAQVTVNAANRLPESLMDFQKWLECNDVRGWCSWGKFDFNQFERECKLKLLMNPLENVQHFNLKNLFARKFKHRVGLSQALSLRGLEFEGRLHSGLADAKNAARLLQKEEVLREAVLKRLI